MFIGVTGALVAIVGCFALAIYAANAIASKKEQKAEAQCDAVNATN